MATNLQTMKKGFCQEHHIHSIMWPHLFIQYNKLSSVREGYIEWGAENCNIFVTLDNYVAGRCFMQHRTLLLFFVCRHFCCTGSTLSSHTIILIADSSEAGTLFTNHLI